MTQPSDRLRIAVFIDFDNIEIGVKNTLGSSFDAGVVLEALKERGEVVSKMAYSDWNRAGGYSRMLSQHAIRMVQRDLTPGGDKNGADINLALDALEMAFTHPHINAFVIVGGDSDFISLVEKLKQYDKKVFIVGGRQFTSGILQRNCHEFIAYENLVASSSSSGAAFRRPQGQGQGRDNRGERAPIDSVFPLVNRALKVLLERDVSPQIGLLKSTLLQLDSTFSERSYGAGSFRDFVEKLARANVLKVYQAKGGWLVGPTDGAAPVEALPAGDETEPSMDGAAISEAGGDGAAVATSTSQDVHPDSPFPPRADVRAQVGDQAEGVREFTRILSTTPVRRWPMYLRNVKQLLRQGSPSFDERAYGFGNLGDLLRAAHKEGIVRVDRDRQGVIRVFQGSVEAPIAQPHVNPAADEFAASAGDEVAAAAVAASSAAGGGQAGEDEDFEMRGNRIPPPQAIVEVEPDEPNFNVAPPDEDPDDNIGNVAPGGARPRRKAPVLTHHAKPARSRAPRGGGGTRRPRK